MTRYLMAVEFEVHTDDINAAEDALTLHLQQLVDHPAITRADIMPGYHISDDR